MSIIENPSQASDVPEVRVAEQQPVTAQPAPHGAKRHAPRPPLQVATGIIVLLAAALSGLLALFVAPAVNMAPHDVPLVVAGQPAAVEQVQAALAQADPDAFEITVVADEGAARTALADRSAYGAIVIGANGPTVYTASAASPVVAQSLTQLAIKLSGTQVPVPVDTAPLSANDPRGAGLAAGAFPMMMAGIALGAVASLALTRRRQIAGTIAVGAAVVGLSLAAILEWFGVLGGHYVAESTAIALSAAAVAFLAAGLIRVIGMAGVGITALIVVFIGNPLAGISSAPELLPTPWGAFGQLLPPGASGTLIRTVSYFPAANVWAPVLVLITWLAVGAVLMAFPNRKAAATVPALATS